MTLVELSRYYWALASQANLMDVAIGHFEKGDEQTMWFTLFYWYSCKDIADEINSQHDNMAFARAIGMSNGIRKAWE
jgi:hypothetical protein